MSRKHHAASHPSEHLETEYLKTAAVGPIASKAGKAVEDGLLALELPPRLLAWADGSVSAFFGAAVPLRKAYRHRPILTSLGLAAVATGSALLVVVLSQLSAHVSPRSQN